MSKKDQNEEELNSEQEIISEETAQKTELEELQEKCAEYENGWKRALADYKNLQQDMAARSEEARKSIKAKLAQDLLPVVDNFAQAVKFQPDLSTAPEDVQKSIGPWLQGILYIEKQFGEAMAEMGIEPIPTDGKFDPAWHDAAEERAGEGEDGQILEVLVPGWKLGDTVLRPAKVIVNKK